MKSSIPYYHCYTTTTSMASVALLLLLATSTTAFVPEATAATHCQPASMLLPVSLRKHQPRHHHQQQARNFGVPLTPGLMRKTTTGSRWAATADDSTDTSNTTNQLPFFLDPNTKGGALVYMVVLFVVPLVGVRFLATALDYDEIEAGVAVGMGFTIVSLFAWMSTYIFRVATKDMTYVRRKEYKNDALSVFLHVCVFVFSFFFIVF